MEEGWIGSERDEGIIRERRGVRGKCVVDDEEPGWMPWRIYIQSVVPKQRNCLEL